MRRGAAVAATAIGVHHHHHPASPPSAAPATTAVASPTHIVQATHAAGTTPCAASSSHESLVATSWSAPGFARERGRYQQTPGDSGAASASAPGPYSNSSASSRAIATRATLRRISLQRSLRSSSPLTAAFSIVVGRCPLPPHTARRRSLLHAANRRRMLLGSMVHKKRVLVSPLCYGEGDQL